MNYLVFTPEITFNEIKSKLDGWELGDLFSERNLKIFHVMISKIYVGAEELLNCVRIDEPRVCDIFERSILNFYTIDPYAPKMDIKFYKEPSEINPSKFNYSFAYVIEDSLTISMLYIAN